MSTRDLDYLGYLARESSRFLEALRAAAPDAPVPSCPEWDADDLLWHLAEVQWFWGTILRERVTETAQAEQVLRDDRPADRAGLIAFYDQARRELQEELAAVSPDTPAWTWSAEQTAGFILRRQAHEALIHRIDAEVTAGDRTPVDPRLAADGVDEVLRIMYGEVPEWAEFQPEEAMTLRVVATDTGDMWLATLGQLVGTDPEDGAQVEEPGIEVADNGAAGEAAATVKGSAADLDCWLWNRPTLAPLTLSGDPEVHEDFETVLAAGIQ
jgi:uncharacterized protein (TIGR03083 family)